MKLSQFIIFTLLACATAAAADAPQTRFFFRDPAAIKISLNEPATGCRMTGQMIHPVEKPATKVVWFTARECGQKKQAVSLISGEIDAPDNMIHKGQKVRVLPVRVEILEASRV